MGIGCLFMFVRPLFRLVFGIIIFLAFFTYLMVSTVTDNLLSADFYTAPLSDNNVYERFYDEVLVDLAYEDTKDELLGDIDIPTDDIAGVAKRIMTPDYLQAEVERTINSAVDYLKKDSDTLDLYIDLLTPLNNAKAVLIEEIDTRIDQLEVVPVRSDELDVFIEGVFREVEAGEIPTQVPSFSDIPVRERLAAYEEAIASLRRDDNVPDAVVAALENPDTDRAIRRSLRAETPGSEDLRDALKQATDGLATPLIDSALDELRRDLSTVQGTQCKGLAADADLSSCTRYDVLQLAAESDDKTKAELLSDLGNGRDFIDLFERFGTWIALLVLVVVTLMLAFVHLPRPSAVLRWPGIILAFTGLVCLVVGLVMNSVIPDRLDSAVEEGIERADLPQSLLLIATDVTTDMAADITSGFISPSIVLLVIGLVMFVGSFFLSKIPFMVLGSLKH